MIELTEQQIQALATSAEFPPRVVDPRTQTTYVLLRQDLYERVTDPDYDDSPWTAEERDALAWEAGLTAGWGDMDEYDRYEKKP